jgi:hypothetical protein
MTPTKKPKQLEPQRYPWFDGWMTAKGPSLKRLVEATIDFVDRHEEQTKARVRARRPTDQANHLRAIEAITCSLAHAVLFPHSTGRIAVKTGHGRKGRSRYDSPVFGKGLSSLVYMLAELDMLSVFAPAVSRGEVTSIAPSPQFGRKVHEFGVLPSDFGRHDDEEIILLNRNTRLRTGWDEEGPGTFKREPIDYADTRLTKTFRNDVRAINAYLREADIEFLADGLEPRIDPFKRTLKRMFVMRTGKKVSFDQGGRLFGGFWENLKSDRRKHIRIDGEGVVVLDYGSMFTRLAYAVVGEVPPDGDLYAIPGLQGYRRGVKLAMNTFLFDGSVRRSWPSEMIVGDVDDAAAENDIPRLPGGSSVAVVKKAILSIHPPLAAVWGRQLGYRLMFQESEILIGILQELYAKGITALGLHDGLLVSRSRAAEVEATMDRIARMKTGIPIPVSVKEL